MMFSACLEWLFGEETVTFADRIFHAKNADVSSVEFWRSSNKDIGAIRSALDETGISLTSFLAEPVIDLAGDPTEGFWIDLQRSFDIAEYLAAEFLIVQLGNEIPGISDKAQRTSVCSNLRTIGKLVEKHSFRVGIEPLNSSIDHKGCYLSSTLEALDILREISSPRLGLIYDIYHSATMGEKTEQVLSGSVDRVLHVHLADSPGRREPGTGTIDFKSRVGWLRAQGYSGKIGLEYKPSRLSAVTVEDTKRLLSPILSTPASI